MTIDRESVRTEAGIGWQAIAPSPQEVIGEPGLFLVIGLLEAELSSVLYHYIRSLQRMAWIHRVIDMWVAGCLALGFLSEAWLFPLGV
jgi:hypothetical protein